MTLRFIDISNWQKGLNLTDWAIDAVVVKATEGLGYVDPCCDGFIQQAIEAGLPYGFYHFARNNNATDEAVYFVENCKGYFEKSPHGVPILDWEDDQSVAWVNEFVECVHRLTGVWPWIYANSWRFNQGGVNENCGRWVAGYPGGIDDFETALNTAMPYETDGLVCAWQFTSTLGGQSLDGDLFYGDVAAWNAYAGNGSSDAAAEPIPEPEQPTEQVETIETDKHVITIKEK